MKLTAVLFVSIFSCSQAATPGNGFVPVTEYGAKCDAKLASGVFTGTDDTKAINGALAASRDVEFPAGKTCMISGALSPRSGTVITKIHRATGIPGLWRSGAEQQLQRLQQDQAI